MSTNIHVFNMHKYVSTLGKHLSPNCYLLGAKKALAVRRRVTKEEYAMAAQQTESRAPKPRLFVAQGNFQKESIYFDIFADTASAKV